MAPGTLVRVRPDAEITREWQPFLVDKTLRVSPEEHRDNQKVYVESIIPDSRWPYHALQVGIYISKLEAI